MKNDTENLKYLNKFNLNYNYAYSSYNADGLIYSGGLKIIQFSDVLCSKDFVSEKHTQLCDEITVFYGGSGEIMVNGRKQAVKKNQLHICFQNDNHTVISNPSDPLQFFCIGFIVDQTYALYELFLKMQKNITSYGFSVFEDNFSITDFCKKAVSELYFKDYNSILPSMHFLLYTINIVLYYTCKNYFPLTNDYTPSSSYNQNLIYEIVHYLNKNMCNKDALKNITSSINYSYSHLSHIFSKVTGENLKEFFHKLRMNAAEKKLSDGFSVTETAYYFNYSSIHTFSRAYKAFFNKNPVLSKSKTQT